MNYEWIKDLKDIHKYKFLCAIHKNKKLIISELETGIPMSIVVKKQVIPFLQIKDIEKVTDLLLQTK